MGLGCVASQCLERREGALAEGALYSALSLRLLNDSLFYWKLFDADRPADVGLSLFVLPVSLAYFKCISPFFATQSKVFFTADVDLGFALKLNRKRVLFVGHLY